MSDRVDPGDIQPDARGADALAPLPGEAGIPHIAQRTRPPLSRKGVLALGLLIASLASVAALSISSITLVRHVAASGWCRSNAGRSERIRGSDTKLCRGGGQLVAHSRDRPQPHGSSLSTMGAERAVL